MKYLFANITMFGRLLLTLMENRERMYRSAILLLILEGRFPFNIYGRMVVICGNKVIGSIALLDRHFLAS